MTRSRLQGIVDYSVSSGHIWLSQRVETIPWSSLKWSDLLARLREYGLFLQVNSDPLVPLPPEMWRWGQKPALSATEQKRQ